MKKKIIITSSTIFVLLVALIIIIVVLNQKGTELYVETFDKRYKLSFGVQDVSDMEVIDEESTTYYKCEDSIKILEVINESSYKMNIGNKSILYYEGYYIQYFRTSNGIGFKNLTSMISGGKFVPFLAESCYELFSFDPEGSHETYGNYIYKNHSYSELSQGLPFVLNSKEKIIDYVNTLNKMAAYYSEEDDCIYLNSYQFRYWVADSITRASDNYPFIMKLFDDGFGAGYKINE